MMGTGRGSPAKQKISRGGATCYNLDLGIQKKGRDFQGKNKVATFLNHQIDRTDRFISPECKKRSKTSPSQQQHTSSPEIGKSGIGLFGVAGKFFPEPQSLSPEENFQEMRIPGIKMVRSLDKLKLQLFPVDEHTRKRLEKDGHNPHLELTLNRRKKITSVINHLNTKWGASSIASGELMLFPCNGMSEALATDRRWTSKDTNISVADVYALVGCPAIFRLRYCWFYNQNSGIPLLGESESVKFCWALKEIQKENNGTGTKDEVKGPCEENRPLPISEAAETMDGMRPGNASAHSLGAWADCLTNISMGSLLGESGDPNCCNPEAAKGDSCLRQISFNCDSFDAAIAAHISRYQNENVSASVSQISVLDAENTCHAFPDKKHDHLRELVPPLCQNAFSEVSGKSASVEVDTTHDYSFHEHPPESQLQINGLDSLQNAPKLSDLSWNDSLGSFDLALLSSSKQIISGDSVNLSSFFASSRDAL